ncbi:Ade12 [Kluyveromyces lactis]|nr:Ade12 [Kluyveromyces lactis]
MVNVVLGSQWGDEGKGKLVDLLVGEYDIVARSAGGNNAGHTIVVNGVKYDFHMLPSGLVNPNCQNLIGNGVVIHVPSFFEELESLEAKGLKNARGRLFISSRAHLVFDFHQRTDKLRELELSGASKDGKNIGTTGKGIGPTYSTKASRSGLRVHHLVNDDPQAWEVFETRYRRLVETRQQRYGSFDYDPEEELQRYKTYREQLKPFVVDSVSFMHDAIKKNKKILVEGANALMLDIDFGTYPYVTSSNTGIGGVITGLGIPPRTIKEVFGVVKAYTTRVGEGPFPTEQLNEDGEKLQNIGAEFGVTTGRKRRCGWLDLVVLKYSNLINGYTSLNITKLDVLDTFKEIKVGISYSVDGKKLESFPEDLLTLAKVEVEYVTLPGWEEDISKITNYEDLPENAQKYLKFIEDFVEVPIQWVGTGPARDAMVHKEI